MVHCLPKRLSVCRVSTTAVVLLSSVINKWNTASGKRKNRRVSQLGFLAGVVAEETRVIVVVYEETKRVHVSESKVFS